MGSPALTPRLLTVRAAAEYMSTTVWTVRNLIWRGELSHLKPGKAILIDRNDLDAWIARNKIGAHKEATERG